MKLRRRLSCAAADPRGSAAIEFALLAPALITMMFGVLQVGIAMQNYNALRGAAADLARHAVVSYQLDDQLTDGELEQYGRSVATRPPYSLDSSRISVSVEAPATQRVAGALEKTITITYSVPTVLQIVNMPDIPLSYREAVFLTDD